MLSLQQKKFESLNPFSPSHFAAGTCLPHSTSWKGLEFNTDWLGLHAFPMMSPVWFKPLHLTSWPWQSWESTVLVNPPRKLLVGAQQLFGPWLFFVLVPKIWYFFPRDSVYHHDVCSKPFSVDASFQWPIVQVVRKTWKEAAKSPAGNCDFVRCRHRKITVVLPRVYYSQRRKMHGSLITNLLNIKLMEC